MRAKILFTIILFAFACTAFTSKSQATRYDSQWELVTPGTDKVFDHQLGVLPAQLDVWIALSDDFTSAIPFPIRISIFL
jgi:hypothetical protein